MQEDKEIIAVVGPTCSGKSSYAIDLALRHGLEIINADSRSIYSEMNIGTAKASADDLHKVKHHLIDIRRPDQEYSADEYRRDFDAVIQKLPGAVVVGGTGLYIKSALDDLDMPPIKPNWELRAKLQTQSLNDLQEKLRGLDPKAHELIDVQNKVRLIRAIEMMMDSGKALAELRTKHSKPRYKVKYIGLNYANRDTLYRLINERVLGMIDQGLIEEVRSLVQKYGKTKTLMSTIGYKEIIGYLEGDFSLDTAINLIQQNTRKYAKRQLTWFRANPQIQWEMR